MAKGKKKSDKNKQKVESPKTLTVGSVTIKDTTKNKVSEKLLEPRVTSPKASSSSNSGNQHNSSSLDSEQSNSSWWTGESTQSSSTTEGVKKQEREVESVQTGTNAWVDKKPGVSSEKKWESREANSGYKGKDEQQFKKPQSDNRARSSTDGDHKNMKRDHSGSNRNRSRWSPSPNRNANSDQQDPKFKEFWKYCDARNSKDDYLKVEEIDNDLFLMPETHCLAHCVAEDMQMGSGIAVQFSQTFKRVEELYEQKQRQGGLAVLEIKGRFIYYLVTKKRSSGKPTNWSLWCSLQKMQKHIEENKVKNLAIPRIGCGLDRLEWTIVKPMLEYIFQDTDVKITVCNFQKPEADSEQSSQPFPQKKYIKCLLVNVSYPLVQIEPYTAVVYFGTQNSDVTEEMKSLDAKFRMLSDYRTKTKRCGDIITTSVQNGSFLLCGFIIKKSVKDRFDFMNFHKCLTQFDRYNRGLKENCYQYVGIEAFFEDGDDDLLLDKIINTMRCTLHKVDVYVCWPAKLAELMPRDRRNDF